jgi:hypothetical protein
MNRQQSCSLSWHGTKQHDAPIKTPDKRPSLVTCNELATDPKIVMQKLLESHCNFSESFSFYDEDYFTYMFMDI